MRDRSKGYCMYIVCIEFFVSGKRGKVCLFGFFFVCVWWRGGGGVRLCQFL